MRPVSVPGASTADRYRTFARVEATGQSQSFESLALGVADSPELIELIDELPSAKRQVNLVFAAARAAGAPVDDFGAFREFLLENWREVRSIALMRSTQTNEAARCAVMLPVLASLPGPLALVEIGASAGLCLYPDRYSYRYGDAVLHPTDGPSTVTLSPSISGPVPVPDRMPEVVWRAGLDLNPLDLFDESNAAWLETLVWPEHDERRARLRAAIQIAKADPPQIRRGDAIEDVAALVAEAPAGATVVVYHSAVLAYLQAADRERFVSVVTGLPVHWISYEGQKVVPGVEPPSSVDPSLFLLALDGQPLALAGAHGQSLDWLS